MSAPTLSKERIEALEYCCQAIPQTLADIYEGARIIAERTGLDRHDLLVVLGSGMRDVESLISDIHARIPLAELPGVARPTAEGHGGDVISATVKGKNVLIFTGRSHLYEGLSPTTVCMPVRIAAACGITAAFVTNAGGCLRDWSMGEVMTITDHMNFASASPFVGGVFVDIAHVWDGELTEVCRRHSDREGVYAILRGPEFQTMAESRYLRDNGVDMVGMSTIMEAIALHQLGVRVCGVSLTSDLSFAATPCTHAEVLAAGQAARPKVAAIMKAVCEAI